MTKGSNFWVIGGEFGSMNFHKLVEGSAQVKGPFKTRKEAEDCWREVSEENRHKAGVRFSLVEEPNRTVACRGSLPGRGVIRRESCFQKIVPKDGRPHPVLPRVGSAAF